MFDIQIKFGIKNVSDLTRIWNQGIYNTKILAKQHKEQHKRWTDDEFVYIRENFALIFRKNAVQITQVILN